ncbi:hypothetical protein HHU12_20930 [Flammeovirga aprica JL-4]|uniref:PH domain-containing protein n=2 Tax=Flammeovirga aprica TaxID=29528 RepID=A0A7X9XBA8_9BACT|nr:hypothetical protein [Flammeovirga aprica JL-4]
MKVEGTDRETAKIIMLIFSGGSFFFLVISCLQVLLVKKMDLIGSKLIITYPLLFTTKQIDITNIGRIYRSRYKITNNRSWFEKNNSILYKGRTLTIVLMSGQNIKLDSLEITEFERFYTLLKARVRRKDVEENKKNIIEIQYLVSIVLTIIFVIYMAKVKL